MFHEHAQKVVSNSPELVDFAIGLVMFVLNLSAVSGEIQITEGLLLMLLIKKGFGAS